MIIGNREFDTKNHCYVMGILNVTPDSFSDGGKWNNKDSALAHVEQMLKDGADIIDIGGESTRPGYTKISDEEEIDRVVPIISAVKREFGCPISVDTYKSGVARAAITAGADLINDIWGLKYDSAMASVIAENNVACCLMHNKGDAVYNVFMDDMISELRETLDIAYKAGIKPEQIMLDPGVGFGKTYENNLEAIWCVDRLHELGLPILLGTSRKSVVGLTLNVPAPERVSGTVATTVIGVMKGCSFVRVHDIKENADAIKMTEAIMNV